MKWTFGLALALFTLVSCVKEEPEIPNEEELITTLIYTLTPDGGGDVVVFSFLDPDGDGGIEPTINSQTLAANRTYSGVVELLNELETPFENIAEEVEEEGDEHQFFFRTNLVTLNFLYDDEDSEGNPIGLKTKVVTGEAGTGQFTITLRHEPDKDAAGVSDGDISNAGGETDIEVVFDAAIQ